jgi:hypothetical protein
MREEARFKAVEHWTNKNLNEHIVVNIAGQRLKKIKGFEDLRCPKCKNPIYKARGMTI